MRAESRAGPVGGVGRGGSGLGRVLALAGALAVALLASVRAAPLRAAAPAVSAADTGRVVAVGGLGALRDTAVLDALLEGRADALPLCVVGDPQAGPAPAGRASLADSAGRSLRRRGGEAAVRVVEPDPGSGSAAGASDAGSVFGGCGGVVLVGSRAGPVLEWLRPEGRATALERALRRRWLDGAMLAGVGDAAAALGVPVVVRGTSRDALGGGVRRVARGEARDTASAALEVREGLEVVTRGIVDTRPFERGRWGRLLVAALDHPRYPVGLGVAGSSALVIDGARARVVGGAGTVVIDARGARRGAQGRVAGVDLSLVGAGGTLRLDEGTWSPPEAAGALSGSDEALPPPRLAAPFAPWRFAYLLVALARRPGTVTFSDPGWTLSLRPGPDFTALAVHPAATELAGIDAAPAGSGGGGDAGPGTAALPGGLTLGPVRVTVTWSASPGR